MDNDEIKRWLRLAFSHREKAEAARAESDRLFEKGQLDAARHEAFRKDCTEHIDRADASIRDTKVRIARESLRLAEDLRRALDDKKRATESLKTGRMPEPQARETLQRIEARVERLRAAIAEMNALHAAKSAQDAGGYIDLPLGRYRTSAIQHARQFLRGPRFSRSSMVALFILLAGILCAALFTFRTEMPAGLARFEILPAADTSGKLSVTCANIGKRPIVLDVPLTEERSIRRGGDSPTRYGIVLYGQESPGGPWKLLPPTAGCWRLAGRPLPPENAFSIDPGISLELTLEPSQLTQAIANIQALRIECGKPGARPLKSTEISVRVP